MFCKIKSFLACMGLKTSDISISLKASPIGIEDEKAVEQRKRIDAVFRDQEHHLQSKALMAHSIDCDDPVFCMKQPCFKWEPDKIVSEVKTIGRPKKKKIEVDLEEKKE